MWKCQAGEGLVGIFSAKQAWPARDQKAEIKELHAKIGELTIEKTADGRLVGVFPIDYLLWSAEVAATARWASDFMVGSAQIKSGEFWFEGRVLPRVRAGLEAALSVTMKQAAGLLMGEPL